MQIILQVTSGFRAGLATITSRMRQSANMQEDIRFLRRLWILRALHIASGLKLIVQVECTSTQIHPPRVPARVRSNVYAKILRHEDME